MVPQTCHYVASFGVQEVVIAEFRNGRLTGGSWGAKERRANQPAEQRKEHKSAGSKKRTHVVMSVAAMGQKRQV